jgi:hypothetical protein
MSRDDEHTPVEVPLAKYDVDHLRLQIREMFDDRELWRPVIETAKILSDRWKTTERDVKSVAGVIDMLSHMVDAAEATKRGEGD